MDQNELRLGNIVFDDELNPMRVARIETSAYTDWNSGDDFNVIIEPLTQNRNNYYESKVNPIELTDKWLLKFGFMREFSEWSLVTDENWIITINIDGSFRYCYRLYSNQQIILKYVHELQNLFFTLTGVELQLSST